MKGISKEFSKNGIAAEFLPISDLAVGGRKFSGNAQSRKKKYFLHHGTVLYGIDIDKVSRYIKHPPKEPGYRTSRPHKDFLTNIHISEKDIKEVIRRALAPGGHNWKIPGEYIKELAEIVADKYSQNSWNFCF
jgi:lipoate-protein ligase A